MAGTSTTTTSSNEVRAPSKVLVLTEQPEFPPVTFDTTLHDLWLDGRDGPLEEAYCISKPNSDPKFGEVVPLNSKYMLYTASTAGANDIGHLSLEICPLLLLIFAGPMQVLFYGAEGKIDDPTLTAKAIDDIVKRTFSVVNARQRPIVKTFANPEDLIRNYDGPPIRWGFAKDFADAADSVEHPEAVFKLNSKRWLADCSLRSANDLILDCEIKCPDHTVGGLWYYGGPDCRVCGSGIETDIHRILNILQDRPPYVLKLTQSLSSVGTLIVRNEDERAEVKKQAEQYLRDYLPRITKENAHIRPTALILSDLIPGETMALNFFVKRDGSVVFLGACHQQSTRQSGRQATAITYADQPMLEKKYRAVLDKIGMALHEEGYCGPVGADIMENPDDGTLFTIDLNVRSALSFILYNLRGHLHVERGYAMSLVIECILLTLSRDDFEKTFAKEMQEAKIILIASTQLSCKDGWAHGMVVAGAGQDELDEISGRILEYQIEGGQDDAEDAT